MKKLINRPAQFNMENKCYVHLYLSVFLFVFSFTIRFYNNNEVTTLIECYTNRTVVCKILPSSQAI